MDLRKSKASQKMTFYTPQCPEKTQQLQVKEKKRESNEHYGKLFKKQLHSRRRLPVFHGTMEDLLSLRERKVHISEQSRVPGQVHSRLSQR